MIAFSLPRTFGKMVGSHKQGYAIVAVMAIIWVGSLAFSTFFEAHHHGVDLADRRTRAMEGKEVRFGIPASSLFTTSHHADLDRRGQLHARLVHAASAAARPCST